MLENQKKLREEILKNNLAPEDIPESELDGYFMRIALRLAYAAALDDEVPVGAIVTRGREIISCGGNGREANKNALHHAEVEAISSACEKLGGWRLTGCTLYVTLEPCTMCTGAIINAHIPRVVYAAKDAKAGALGSVINAAAYPLGWKPRVDIFVESEAEAKKHLGDFFRRKRDKHTV